jgi:hypothetical protein
MPRSRWRRVGLLLCCLVLVFVWATSAYQLVEGRVIDARVISCGFGPHNSCEVAWSYGGAHGTESTDGMGASPGGLMPVYYVPGQGVTNRDSVIGVTVIVPAGACVVIASVLWKRRRRVSVY